MNVTRLIMAGLLLAMGCSYADSDLSGRVFDPQSKVVAGAAVRLESAKDCYLNTTSDVDGSYRFRAVPDGDYQLKSEAPGFLGVSLPVTLRDETAVRDIVLSQLPAQHQSIVISSNAMEPRLDLRNQKIFNRTLFARDDQVLQQLAAGIDAAQHEGGGKSVEIRRFGFNLDHGGVNGGLKVLVDGVQQNQGTQGHGQGYLGALKALSPELIEDVTITNGPFSAEYGDFSGLGVVHIHQREALPNRLTLRMQGGNFDSTRRFIAYSPDVQRADAYLAYEGSYTDGPFQNPGRYRRDNVNANYTRVLGQGQKLGFRVLIGRNDFYSSGQIPLDLVNAGTLDRFGYIDPNDGGKVRLGTASVYFSKALGNGDTFKTDGFLSRSLFDLYSNFTYFRNDPQNGDAFQQHDSRLQEGWNTQYMHAHRLGSTAAVLVTGTNFHDNEIRVGLYPRTGRAPIGVSTLANAHVTNGAEYAQESLSLLHNRLLLGAGARYDAFRYAVSDRVWPAASGSAMATRWQAKANAALTPLHKLPFTLHANYGRGINSLDARGVAQRPDQPRLAATDFYQLGSSSNLGRFSVATDVFLIEHSNEQVYVPDDGSIEFQGPSRAYGYEAKASLAVSRHLSLNVGMTKVSNAFFKGTAPRRYVVSAPHLVANAALTMAAWHGWSGSLRMRAINQYRLDEEDSSIVASGHTVLDMSLSRELHRGIELNLSLDNLTSRDYYETQNYFESRVTPGLPAVARIHGTPGYSLTAVVGLTFRLGGR